jgi:hypothetical protein
MFYQTFYILIDRNKRFNKNTDFFRMVLIFKKFDIFSSSAQRDRQVLSEFRGPFELR